MLCGLVICNSQPLARHSVAVACYVPNAAMAGSISLQDRRIYAPTAAVFMLLRMLITAEAMMATTLVQLQADACTMVDEVSHSC